MNDKQSMADNFSFTKLSVVAGEVAEVLKQNKGEGSREICYTTAVT